MVSDELVERATEALREIKSVNVYGMTRDEIDAMVARKVALAITPAIRAEALEEAAMWHDAEIARLDHQIAENNAYMMRMGWKQISSDANEACREHQRTHRLSAAAIRAMKGKTHD